MAKDVKFIPVEVCFKYIGILETTNEHLRQLHEASAKMLEDKKISKGFFDEQNKILIAKVNDNNKIIDRLEKRIFETMQNDLGRGVFLPNKFAPLEEKIKQEMDRFKKEYDESVKNINQDELAVGLKSGKFQVNKPKMEIK